MVADFAPVARSGKSPGTARTFLQRLFRIPAVLLRAASCTDWKTGSVLVVQM